MDNEPSLSLRFLVCESSECQRGENFKQARTNGRSNHGFVEGSQMMSPRLTTIHHSTSGMQQHHTNSDRHNNRQQQQQQYNLGGSTLTGEEPPAYCGEFESCSLSSGWPNPIPAIPPYVVKTPHLHGAPTTEETSLLLNPNTKAGSGKNIEKKKKKETHFSGKLKKRNNWENDKGMKT